MIFAVFDVLVTVTGTFAPRNFRSRERKFHRVELSLPIKQSINFYCSSFMLRFIVDVIYFCCMLQRCMLHVLCFIVVVIAVSHGSSFCVFVKLFNVKPCTLNNIVYTRSRYV